MVNIYTPNIKNVKTYDLGEEIEVSINGQAVIPILADKIYKSPYSAIRELYNNEVTATKRALRIDPKLTPEIILTLDTVTRELKIKGVNTSSVSTNKHTCHAKENNNNCGDCRKCWDQNVLNVVYPLH